MVELSNHQVQDILDDMGMIDENGNCPYTAEEIFKAGIEYAVSKAYEDGYKTAVENIWDWITEKFYEDYSEDDYSFGRPYIRCVFDNAEDMLNDFNKLFKR